MGGSEVESAATALEPVGGGQRLLDPSSSLLTASAARTFRSLKWGVIALNVLVAGICGVVLWAAWQNQVRNAEIQTRNAARLTEQSVSAALDKAALALEAAGVQMEHQMSTHHADLITIVPEIDVHTDQIPEMQRINIHDAQGNHICTRHESPCNRFSIADRVHFQRLHEHPDDPIQLYGPYTSRTDAQRVLLLARPIRKPSGEFSGVATALVPLQRLQNLIAQTDLGPHSSVGIRTESLELLARQPAMPSSAPPSAGHPGLSTLQAAFAKQPSEGILWTRGLADNVQRITAYKRLRDYPLYVLVGISTDEYLTTWRSQLLWTIGFFALFVAVSSQVVHLTRISLRRQALAQRLYDEAPCGYHALDAQGRFISINATELEWLECKEREVVKKRKVTDFFSEEGRATFQANFPKFLQTGHIDGLEVDLISRSGRVRRVLVNAKAVLNASGQFLMSNSVMHDITALHQARQQLQTLATEQAVMLDNELVGIIKTCNRRILWSNRGMERIFGYHGDEWHDMPARRLYGDDETYHRVGQESLAAVQAGLPYRTQLQMMRKDGSPVWIDASAVCVSQQTQELMLLLADITPLKQVEEERIRAIELNAQNAQLQETNRLKNEFLSNMSHELRTPLNAIIGFAQLLESPHMRPDSPQYPMYVHQISINGQHLLTLIETMLDYAAVEAKKMAFTPQRVQVSSALQEVIDLLRSPSQAKQVTVSMTVADGLNQVVTDPLRLRQMLLCLVDNAIKFSKPGGRVDIAAHAMDDIYWAIQVIDHGIGVAKNDLPKLFLPFVQLSAGDTKAYGGTGLGLTLARHIAQAQGGRIEVQSELNQGSIFTLVLPRQLNVQPM